MKTSFIWLAAVAVVASVAAVPAPRDAAAPASPCAADSNYQRLGFWVGDWVVYDSTGKRYAAQRVRTVVDACAITAEWTGTAGDKGLSMSGLDKRSGEWRQLYVSNQVPYPSGAPVRKSDPSYTGPGIRFIPLLDPPAGVLTRSRVTIMPLSDHRAMQLFEDSRDGGQTWKTVFKAEHRSPR
jgi:hypothetical protein